MRPDCPLTYEIIVNWVIAEHKSQGLLQTEAGKHDREEFWVFRASGPAATVVTDQLFGHLASDIHAQLQH